MIEIMISLAILALLAVITLPNYIAYRNKSYCTAAENDAHVIIARLIDYFAIPAHDSLLLPVNINKNNAYTANGITYPVLSNNNYATLKGNVDNITIELTDSTGRCPEKYQQAIAEWSGGVYTTTIQ